MTSCDPKPGYFGNWKYGGVDCSGDCGGWELPRRGDLGPNVGRKAHKYHSHIHMIQGLSSDESRCCLIFSALPINGWWRTFHAILVEMEASKQVVLYRPSFVMDKVIKIVRSAVR